LRPLFFRLLRSAIGGANHRPKSNAIGPRTGGGGGGGGGGSDDPSEASWQTWLLAAQGAVNALGREEQHRLWVYVDLCIRRRAALSSSGLGDSSDNSGLAQYPALGGGCGSGPAPSSQWDAKQIDRTTSADFPSLDGGGGGSAQVEGPGAGWGRPRQQPPPPLAQVKRSGPPRAAATGWDEDEAEAFPSLGGASQARQETSWGAKAEASAANAQTKAAAAQQPKAKPPMQAQSGAPSRPPAGVADFPTLGTGGGSSGAGAGSWAAQARERERAAVAVAAAPPLQAPDPKPEKKDFDGVGETSFPGLPSAGPAAAPRMSAAAKAGARAGMLAKAKAKAKAAHAHAAASSSQPPALEPMEADGEPHKEEETLLLIHNPLDAVALSEAANASRKTKATGPKRGGASRGSVVNPWGSGAK